MSISSYLEDGADYYDVYEPEIEECPYNNEKCYHNYDGMCTRGRNSKCPSEGRKKKHIKDSTELSGGHLW